MASVHQEEALACLHALAATDCAAATVAAALDARFPAWRANAVPMAGYGDAEHHVALVVSHCLHGALPPPFSLFPYQWEQMHGFMAVRTYLSQPSLPASDVKTLLDAAAAGCARILAG